jgi:hypothetical protein
MLFRIYDVIFAEGASETIMRVALSLMRKNEEKILACTEFEDVMQLLLSRGLWDCYHYNADDFVNDFVSLTGVVTHESLKALEATYKDSTAVDTTAVLETVGSAASRFLGRLWAGSNSSTKSTNLSPSFVAPSRPVSFLRRSPSKQSITSTLNSIEGVGSDSMFSNSTEATSISRDSSHTDGSSIRTQSVTLNNIANNASKSNKDKNLHGQIEDLLTALSEMQRDHAILATQLQKEREEREEDRQAVRSLLDGLRKKSASETVERSEGDNSLETVIPLESQTEEQTNIEIEGTTLDSEIVNGRAISESSQAITADHLSSLLDVVEQRFAPVSNRRSSMLQSKSQLREAVARAKEQLINEVSKSQDFARQISELQHEISSLKDQVKEGHGHIRNAHSEKQRLEKQVSDLKQKKAAATTPDASKDNESERHSRMSVHGGLRELKLGRTNSNRSQAATYSKRISSLNTAALVSKENEISSPSLVTPLTETKQEADFDALVLELVQAKTAEAVAKQEAEEAKAKLEGLRKLLGMPAGESPGAAATGHRPSPSQPLIERSTTMGLGGYMNRGSTSKAEATPTPVSTLSGSFWGGWGKRTVSTEKVPVSGG